MGTINSPGRTHINLQINQSPSFIPSIPSGPSSSHIWRVDHAAQSLQEQVTVSPPNVRLAADARMARIQKLEHDIEAIKRQQDVVRGAKAMLDAHVTSSISTNPFDFVSILERHNTQDIERLRDRTEETEKEMLHARQMHGLQANGQTQPSAPQSGTSNVVSICGLDQNIPTQIHGLEHYLQHAISTDYVPRNSSRQSLSPPNFSPQSFSPPTHSQLQLTNEAQPPPPAWSPRVSPPVAEEFKAHSTPSCSPPPGSITPPDTPPQNFQHAVNPFIMDDAYENPGPGTPPSGIQWNW